MKESDWDAVLNFTKSEWVKDPDRVVLELVFTVDDIRTMADVPVYIIEAFATSGHADGSYHYLSLACDFYFEMGKLTPLEQFIIISSFKNIGGIGYYPVHYHKNWHIDLRFGSSRLYWVYDGDYRYGWKELSKALVA